MSSQSFTSAGAVQVELTPRQSQRRHQIIHAAEQLIMDRGYNQTSMKAIADLAEVTEKTLYNIYGTKAALMSVVYRQRSRDDFQLALRSAPGGGLRFLQNLVRQIAHSSLALPALAREGIQVILAYRDVVSTHDEYVAQVQKAFTQIQQIETKQEMKARDGLVRSFLLSVVAGLDLWAHGQLQDKELKPYLELQLYQSLLHLASPADRLDYLARIARLSVKLAPKASAPSHNTSAHQL